VFLRTLEYYQGILILTTNRVGTFDEAFQSRIDLAIRYDPLTAELRLQIWKHCLRLNQKDAKVNIEDLQSHLHELASHDFNGRQIRGAVKTALELARFSGVPMGWSHICEAVENISSFTQDLLALTK
jgi:SpoVK/Ycf46/Vps4 family AAA+-type ATPase